MGKIKCPHDLAFQKIKMYITVIELTNFFSVACGADLNYS